jgi:hypothetical protein
VNPHIAARQLALNFRFAVGGGAADRYEPGSEAVLWWSAYPRCGAPSPGGRNARSLRYDQDLPAKADIPLPPQRPSLPFPGTSHGGGRGGFSSATPAPPNGCVLPANPNPETETMKALTVAFVDWVTLPRTTWKKQSQASLRVRSRISHASTSVHWACRRFNTANLSWRLSVGRSTQTPPPDHFIPARTLFGTFATTLYFESTSSAK